MHTIPNHIKNQSEPAFTLVELLAVTAMLALLVLTVLPAMSSAKVRSRITGCMDNQRQLAMGWRMRAQDNNGGMVGFNDFNTTDWRIRPGAGGQPAPGSSGPFTNARQVVITLDQSGYRAAALYPYAKNVEILHCPGDGRINRASTPAYGSYAGVGEMGSTWNNTSQLLHPDKLFLWAEENDPRAVALIAGSQSWQIGENLGPWNFQSFTDPPQNWWDAPAVFHMNSAVFSYADGHVATRRWVDHATLWIAEFHGPDKPSLATSISASFGGPDGLGSPNDLPFFIDGYTRASNR